MQGMYMKYLVSAFHNWTPHARVARNSRRYRDMIRNVSLYPYHFLSVYPSANYVKQPQILMSNVVSSIPASYRIAKFKILVPKNRQDGIIRLKCVQQNMVYKQESG